MSSDSDTSPSPRIDIVIDHKSASLAVDDNIVLDIKVSDKQKGDASKKDSKDKKDKKAKKSSSKSGRERSESECKKDDKDKKKDKKSSSKSVKEEDEDKKKGKKSASKSVKEEEGEKEKDEKKKKKKMDEEKKDDSKGDEKGEGEGEGEGEGGEDEEEDEILENIGHENTTSATIKNERRAECTCTEYVENQFKKGGLCTRCLHPKAAHVDGHCEALSLFFFKRLRRRKKRRDADGNVIAAADDTNPEYEYFDGDMSHTDDDEYSYEYVDEDGKVVDPPTPIKQSPVIMPKITIEPPKVEVKVDIPVDKSDSESDEKSEKKDAAAAAVADPIIVLDVSSSSSSSSSPSPSLSPTIIIRSEKEDEKDEKKKKEEEKKPQEKETEKEKEKEKFVEIFDDGYYDEEGKFHPYNNEGYDEFGGYYDDDGYYCDDNGFYDENGDYHEFKGFDEFKEFITQTDNLEGGFDTELRNLEKELKENEAATTKTSKSEKRKKREKERANLEAAKKRKQKRKELAEKKKLAKLEQKKKKKKKGDNDDSDYDDDDDDDDEDFYNDMDDEDKEEVDKIKKVTIVTHEGAAGITSLDKKMDARLAGRWCAEEELPDREEPELKLIMSERVDEDDAKELREEEIKKQNAEARRRARDMREKAILEKKERLNRQKKLREYEPPGKDNSSPFDMISFVRKAVPDKTALYKSRVLKTRRGCLAMIYEGYKDENRERDILYAKKISPSRYLISVNEDFSKTSEGVVAEFLVGQNMEYTTLKELDYTEYTDDRNELIGIWRLPLRSSDEPISLNVAVPNKFLVTYNYWKSTDGVLVHMLKSKETDDLRVLETKKPIWDDVHNQRILNFHGRVKSSSIKNIQIVDPKETRKVLLQFGRVDHSTFILDYKHPFSAVQAFAVAITMIS